ncbi:MULTISPECIES: SsgA family sporulation/cell division regulator [Streptomyces]|uniref:SsgA family sporulation/cell division regulator n=1 Tax=Streptomyces chengmaiensis TaxID=3040919 RepID=A0ABT6HTD8_9ACTN|nr:MULTISPECIES: SsgA family sporulation/cell division regulator [Streptomyces]MDH2391988.1 SsgA family sporulation/cell division regulator [Streptomyces chengmaiensis]WRQ80216.1 SsgA family sporulation/cell division regulator [Streptomyces sp. MUM 178J]
MSSTVAQSVPARLINDAAPHTGPAIPVRLRYTAEDPYAMRMDFPAEASLADTGVTWVFARSLLESGLSSPSGAGDVHIWPWGPAQTMVELRSPEGVALLRFGTAALRSFLVRSYGVVPAGGEADGMDVEEALALLLGETHG